MWRAGCAAGRRAEILELHGQIGPAEQDRAVSGREPGGSPRIIVATSLAESSLTVPGVRLVVDSGLSREPRRDASRGMSGLVNVSCSRASAEQRAGRAARQGPGRVVRCYDQKTFGAAPAHPTPEIAVADLTGAALVLACWGSPGGRGLSLPDAPPLAAMDEAVEVLRELGAVGADGTATDLGRALARVPADPRLARALLDGAAAVGNRAAAEAVALVAGDQRAPGADLPRLLAALRTGKDPASRRWTEDVRRMEAIARQERSGVASPPTTAVTAAEAAGYVVALAFPDRVARRVPGEGPERYLLTSGTRAGLPAGSSLSGHEWLAVAEVSRAQGRDAAGTGAVIRSAAPLTADTAEAAARHLLSETVEARFSQGRVTARKERRLGAIVLSSTPVRPSAAEGRAAVARALEKEGLGSIGWSTAADALRRRLALVRRELGDPWPDVSEPALLARLDEWLAPELAGAGRRRRHRAVSTWPSRCGASCRGPRPAGSGSWCRNGLKCRAAPGSTSTTRRWTTMAAARWWPSSCRNASAGTGRRGWWAAGCRCCSTCFRPPGGPWPSRTTSPRSGPDPMHRSAPRCGAGTRGIPGRRIRGRRRRPPEPRAGADSRRLLRDCDVAHGVLGILIAVRKSAVHASQGIFIMTSKLDITVAVDLSSESALVSPQGKLTVRNVSSLIAVARRAGSFGYGLHTVVDLRKLTAADPEAVAMIRDSGWQGSHLLGAGKAEPGACGMRPELASGYGSLAHAHGAELMFDSFRRWPLVPSSQLVRLRSALLQCVELASPDKGRDLSESAGKLLQLVTDELERRNDTPGPAVLPAGFRRARRLPHA